MDECVVDASDISCAVVDESNLERAGAHGLGGEGSFGAGNTGNARIDAASHVDGASERFECSLHHVVRVAAVEHFKVKVCCGVVGEGAQKLFEEGVREMILGYGCGRAEIDEGASAEIHHSAREGFVHRHIRVPISCDAFSVTQGLGKGLSEGNAGILDGVVEVHFDVALGFDRQVREAVLCEQSQHVVQKRDSGCDLGMARAIDLE